MAKKNKQLTIKEYGKAMVSVARLSFSIAPFAVSFKLIGIIINAALPIVVTFLAAQTINQLTAAYNGTAGAGRLAIIYAIAAAVLGLVTTFYGSLDTYIQQVMRFKIEARVSDIMYDKFLSLEFWRYDDKTTIDLYDRAQKFAQFYAYIFDRLASVITQLVTLVFALIALFIFTPWLAIAVLIAVLPGVVLQFSLSRNQLRHWNDNIDSRRARSYIEWNLLQPTAISELRLNGLVKHFMAMRRDLRHKDEGQRLAMERRFMPQQLAGDTLEAVVQLGALLWIVVQIINREQPIGQFLYVQQLVSRALGGANGFVRELSTIDEDLGNLYDYQAFMKLPERAMNGSPLKSRPLTLQFATVSFSYPGQQQQVLQNIDLTISKSQHLAIVGENGAGKTTLIKLLTGLYAPSDGVITVDGNDLQSLRLSDWHRQLSVLHQDFQTYMFASVKDNVTYGDVDRPYSQKRYDDALAAAEARDFVDKLPNKDKTYPGTWVEDEDGNPGVALSGGQWQRLALARNFYRDASIIIMDEPTSAIDALAETRIFDKLFAKANDKTVITVSHRLSTVEKADVIVVMENGRIVERGTHTELVALNGAYCRLFKRQLSGKL